MSLGRALFLLACAAAAGGRGPVDATAGAVADVAADSTAVAPDSLPQVDRILMPASRAADAISEKVAMFGRRIAELRESQRRSLEHQKSQDEHELRAASERERDEREKLTHLEQVIGQLKTSNDAKRECGRKLDTENEGLRERLRVLKERAASASEFAANSLKEADDSQSAVVAVVRAGEEVAADARELKVVTAQAEPEPAKPVAKVSAKPVAKPVAGQTVEKSAAKVVTKATDAAAPAKVADAVPVKAVSKLTVTVTKAAAKTATITAAASAPVKAGTDAASAKVEKVAEPTKPASHEAEEEDAENSNGDEDSDDQQAAPTAAPPDEDEDYDSFVQLRQAVAMQEQLLLGVDDELLDDALFDPAAAAAGAAVNSSDGHKLPWRRTADVEGSGMLRMLESDLAAMASQEQRSLAKLGALFHAKLGRLETEVSLLTDKEKKLSTQKAFLLGVARRLDRSLDSLEKTQAALQADLAQAGKFFDNLSHFAAGSIDAMDRP